MTQFIVRVPICSLSRNVDNTCAPPLTPAPLRPQYVCRLNRSDSDSAIPTVRRGGSFLRGAAERRSLRWKLAPSAAPPSASAHRRSQSLRLRSRTSLDLELDLKVSRSGLEGRDGTERRKVWSTKIQLKRSANVPSC